MSVVYGTADAALIDELPVYLPKRDVARAMGRGFLGHCPNCGKGKIFNGYTTVNDACPRCGEVLSHQRADDFPPYITMFITGHIVIASMLLVERAYHPDLWIHMALWLPLTLILSLGLLRPIKGAIIGLQWALYMHGFDPRKGEDRAIPDPAGSLRNEG
jgi:uncharacterized protein (DUF983 family)